MLFKRPVPSVGLFLGSGYLEVLSAAVLLGFASMCLGLLISAILSSTEQAMPILVGLTMGQVVLSGALPGKNSGFFELISPLVPSYWLMNIFSATTNLVKISLISDADLVDRWESSLSTLSQGSSIVIAMSCFYLTICYIVLVKKR